MRFRWSLAAAAVACTAGCGTVQASADKAAQVSLDFGAAVAAGSGAAACQLLTDSAVESVESGDNSCQDAILTLELPGAGTVTSEQVWGRAAQVVTTSDVVFLARVDGEWKVRAAGCQPDPPRPYDCALDGS